MSTHALRNGLYFFSAGWFYFARNKFESDEAFVIDYLKSGFNVTDRVPTECEIVSSHAIRNYFLFFGFITCFIGLLAEERKPIRLVLLIQVAMSIFFLYEYKTYYPNQGFTGKLAYQVQLFWAICCGVGGTCLLYDFVKQARKTEGQIPTRSIPGKFRTKTIYEILQDELKDEVYYSFFQKKAIQDLVPQRIQELTYPLQIAVQIGLILISRVLLILFAAVFFVYTVVCAIFWVVTFQGSPFRTVAPHSYLPVPTVVLSGRLRVWLLHAEKVHLLDKFCGIKTCKPSSSKTAGHATIMLIVHICFIVLFSYVTRKQIIQHSPFAVTDTIVDVARGALIIRSLFVTVPFFLQFEFLIEYILANKNIPDPSIYLEFLIFEFGECYPFGNGIGISNYKRVKEMIEDPDLRKSNLSLGWTVSAAQYRFSDKTTTFYPEDELQKSKVTAGRNVVRVWLEDIQKNLKDPHIMQQIEAAIPYPPEDGTMLHADRIGRSFGIALFHLLTGGQLTREEIESYERLAIKFPLPFLPDWFNFLADSGKGRRQGRKDYEAIRSAIVRYSDSLALQRALEEARKDEWKDPETVRFLTMVFCIAGAAAPAKLTTAVVKRIYDAPGKNLELYEKNPYLFIIETARLDKAVPGVNVVSHDAKLQLPLYGKMFTVDKGTPLNLSILMANRDKDAFGQHADFFNPERPASELKQMLTWNGTEKLLGESETKKPPRGCPGHSVSLAIMKFLVDTYKPNEEKRSLANAIRPMRIKEVTNLKLTKYIGRLLNGAKKYQAEWNSNFPLAPDVLHPKDTEQKHLKFIKLPFGYEDDTLPTYDEDRTIDKLIPFKKALLTIGLMEDTSDDWESPEEAMAFRVHYFGNLYPKPNIIHKDVTGDEVVSHIAFAGFASFRTKKVLRDDESEQNLVWKNAPANALYVNDNTRLAKLKVRAGYQRYGAAAYFDENFDLVGIYSCCDQKLVQPPDDSKKDEDFFNLVFPEQEAGNPAEWEHAKWAWKVSAFALATIVDHMGHCHLMEANSLVTATRKHLSVDHPFRALCKMFTYSVVTVNYTASEILFSSKGFVERVWSFEKESLTEILKTLKTEYEFELLPKKIHKSMRDVDDKYYPANKDAEKFWDIMHKFVHDFMCAIYSRNGPENDCHSKTKLIFLKDAPMQKCLDEICRRLKIEKCSSNFRESGVVPFDQAVDIFANLFCSVTAMHEHVGHVSDYASNPTFVGTTLRSGKEMDSIQTNCLLNALVSSTGLRMPKLLGDWEHLLQRDIFACSTIPVMRKFQEGLHQLSYEIDQDNSDSDSRRFKMQSFNPICLESSLSV